ncbi:MAG: DUF2958 domain-containing protein, partial [Paraclostridium sp.]
MKLMTKELEKSLPAMYSMEGVEDKEAVVKYFNPAGAGTWYGIEYDPEHRIFFGYADIGYGGEYGDFSLDELESISLFGG